MKLHEAIDKMGKKLIRPVGHRLYGYRLNGTHLECVSSRYIVDTWQKPRAEPNMMLTNAYMLAGEWEIVTLSQVDKEQ